jgi:3-keto-disaccharide hydrolase
MKKILISSALLLGALIYTSESMAQSVNKLTSKEQKNGWKLLFDGTTTNGWHTYLQQDVSPSWKVVDGALELDPAAKKDGAHGGDLVTNDEYENYELALQWKISEGGNSGIIFNVHEDPEFKQTYLTGPEMQVLDDAKHPDGKITKHNSGDLYDLKKSAKNAVKPVGEWNQVKIQQKDSHLTLWLNGVQTVSVVIGSDEWKELLANSKFKTWPGFAKYGKGHIALQDHGNKVWYRDIKIRTL